MSKPAKVWLIIVLSLVLVGCGIFIGVMSMLEWDFTKLSTAKYETNNYQIHEDYKSISIVTNTADIVFVPAENGESSVVCFEQKNMKHSVAVLNGKLIIELVDTRKWYEHIGINFNTPKITVSIPQGEYGSLSIKGSTGDVEIPNAFTFESMDISNSIGDIKNAASASGDIRIHTSTGDIRVEKVSAAALDLSVSTGGIAVSNATCEGDVKNVIAADKYSIERSTGDVKFSGCDAAEIRIETDTGDVSGTLLSQKVFITETSAGRIRIPKTTSGGKCEIKTSTGDIDISLQY